MRSERAGVWQELTFPDRRAFEHTRANTWFIWMPLFKETRQQPGFEELIREIGLVDYWDEFDWPTICQRVDGDHIRCN